MRGNRAIGGGCASREGGAAGVVAVAAAAAARYLFVDEEGPRILLRQLLQSPSRGDISFLGAWRNQSQAYVICEEFL